MLIVETIIFIIALGLTFDIIDDFIKMIVYKKETDLSTPTMVTSVIWGVLYFLSNI